MRENTADAAKVVVAKTSKFIVALPKFKICLRHAG